MQILGSLDRCDESLIEGWITVADDPETKLQLDILLDDTVIGQCVADKFRKDLQDAGLGDGHCAFSVQTPTFIPKAQIRSVAVRIAGSPMFLSSPPVPRQAGGATGETLSRFGGLWIDRHDWLDTLALKHREGAITDALCISIFKFLRDGYLIIDGAVPSSVIDQVNSEIDRVWVSPPDGLKIETFEPDDMMKLVAPDLRFRGGRTKMLDLYAYSPIVREAIAAPKIIEFLSAIFEHRPKAFQGLTFWNGSQQAIHKDTAYVKVDSNPMHLAATWMALEDIQPGTGELEYYIGSHRAPDYLFGGYSKWMETHTEEHGDFLQSLHADAESFAYKKGSFHAKKGDVLVWHADLAHGGSPIKDPSLTRRSLVTHFTREDNEPFYRRNSQFATADERYCQFVSQYSDIPGS